MPGRSGTKLAIGLDVPDGSHPSRSAACFIATKTVNQQILQMLRQFGRDGRSGVFTCESEEATRFLMLKNGVVVGSRSTLDAERMGEFLVGQGVISSQHLDDASHFARRGKRLGEVLAKLDIIAEEEIPIYVSLQTLEIACKAILQAESGAEFEPKKDVAQILPEPLTVPEILMEVSRRTTTIQSLANGLRNEHRCLEFSEGSDELLQQIHPRAYEAFVLKRIREGGSVASMFADSVIAVEETARAIIGYLSVGIVELAEPSADVDVDARQATAS